MPIAVVGAGAIGRAHIATIERTSFAAVAGVSEPSDAGRAYVKARGIPSFATAAELIASVKPEAAIIATPNDTHLPLAREFIAARIPVLVEKPITSTVADGEALVAAAQQADVPVLVGHHRRHNPIIKTARTMIADGRLGRLVSVTVLAGFLKPPGYFDLSWRRQPGGGPILINLIHEIDLVRHICGEIATVQAVSSNEIRRFEVEDSAAIILRLVNGALVTINLSDTVAAPWSWDLSSGESPTYPKQPGPVASHFLSGTDASLALPTLEYWAYRNEKSWFAPISREQVPLERADPYTAQILHLCRVARGEEQPLISAADGLQTVRATLAVHDAARNGQTVVINAR
jgi:predicted dehydrogenase